MTTGLVGTFQKTRLVSAQLAQVGTGADLDKLLGGSRNQLHAKGAKNSKLSKDSGHKFSLLFP